MASLPSGWRNNRAGAVPTPSISCILYRIVASSSSPAAAPTRRTILWRERRTERMVGHPHTRTTEKSSLPATMAHHQTLPTTIHPSVVQQQRYNGNQTAGDSQLCKTAARPFAPGFLLPGWTTVIRPRTGQRMIRFFNKNAIEYSNSFLCTKDNRIFNLKKKRYRILQSLSLCSSAGLCIRTL